MAKRVKNPRTALGIKWGEGSVRKRGEKWEARWPEAQTDGSVRWRGKTLATQDAAIDHLRDVARAKKEQRYVARDNLTVEAMVTAYLERGRRRWTGNTFGTYHGIVDRHILPAIGQRNVHDLTVDQLQGWVDGLVTAGRIGPSVIATALHIVSAAFKEAVRLGKVRHNPAADVKSPSRDRPVMVTWTAEQARRVLNDRAGPVTMRALYQVALTTGMRPGELRALQWRDIDLVRGTAQVRRSMTRDAQLRAMLGTETKTLGSRRTVALTSTTVTALQQHRDDQIERRSTVGNWEDLDIVFDNGAGHWLSQTSWYRYHDAMCARLGIPRMRLHDLRHTAATLLLEQNVHPKIVADLLGHSSVTMTLDRYSHVSDSLQRSAVDALDRHLADTTTSDDDDDETD